MKKKISTKQQQIEALQKEVNELRRRQNENERYWVKVAIWNSKRDLGY